MNDTKVLNRAADNIRILAAAMVEKANSGHPGMVLGSAPALYTLFTKELTVDPRHSKWFNRDRFVLASGHASALLYTLLHLSGFAVSMDDLKSAIEAVLFASGDSVPVGRLSLTFSCEEAAILEAARELEEEYASGGRGITESDIIPLIFSEISSRKRTVALSSYISFLC